MENKMEALKITKDEGDIIEIFLTEKETPAAYSRKKHELVCLSGMTEEEAGLYLLRIPVTLELFYDMDRGAFGVETDAVSACEIYNPYTGQLIPNENFPEQNTETD